MRLDDRIAIVGIGGLFPGAESPDQFWANVRAGIDSTSDVPPRRWLIEAEHAFDSRIGIADRVYSIRGGFITEPRLDVNGLAIDASLVERLDPVFRLALHVVRQAWSDAQTEKLDRSRVGVVFGNIVLPTETASELSREILGVVLDEMLGAPAQSHEAIEPMNAFPAGLPAALVARALSLGGPAYTIDAACASSLYALKLAVDALQTRRADAMICGGLSRPDSLYTQMGFSQLRALSARGQAAPLDERGDGLVVGEGAGMFVLKRLADALAHGDNIYALVAGIGLSNDVHGDLLAPSSEGQLRAMRAAYDQAGWRPDDVDLIECHATGTPVGDAVELASLKALWGESGWLKQQCAIGSVKSNIGHALTAAGAAGLLKLLLALANKTVPPTANFERAAPKLELDQSPFRVLKGAEPWPKRAADKPRRAAISGFGFGGINAHVLIEEWDPSLERQTRPGRSSAGESAQIAIVGLSACFGPFDRLPSFESKVLGFEQDVATALPRNWWGIPETLWFRNKGLRAQTYAGYYIDSLALGIDEFRIPPNELAEMLPQQSLMLRVAAAAIRDAVWISETAPRTAVLIGIGLDLNATNYHLRWSMADRARTWNQELSLELSHDARARWVDDLKRSAGPPLTANRTMGSLGGLIASRIAREFRIGGPSFTASCDETSGIQALAIAADWVRRGELDSAIVGAVDFAGDPRAVIARRQLSDRAPGTPCTSDGAVALVIKRLQDAVRDGDHVYAILDSSHQTADHATQEIESIEADVGNAGAATGLATVAKAALCLDRRILPTPGHGGRTSYWMRNRAAGTRRARVRITGLGGVHAAVNLEESDADTATPRRASLSPQKRRHCLPSRPMMRLGSTSA